MNEYSYVMFFLTAAVIINIAPGPDMIFLVTRTISQGKRTGFATVLGLGTGAFIHTIFAAAGISAIIASSALAFSILKYIGAAYLIYLGLKALLSGRTVIPEISEHSPQISFLKAYKQAIFIDLFNPKVAVFFLAFLPQFYREGHGSRGIQFLILGIVIIGIGFIVETGIVISAHRLSKFLRRSKRTSQFLDKLLGTVMISLGLRILFDKQR